MADFASLAAWVGRGAADLSLPPSGQSRARNLVAGSRGTRPHACHKAMAQHARHDLALWFGCASFFAGAAHDLRASPLGAPTTVWSIARSNVTKRGSGAARLVQEGTRTA